VVAKQEAGIITVDTKTIITELQITEVGTRIIAEISPTIIVVKITVETVIGETTRAPMVVFGSIREIDTSVTTTPDGLMVLLAISVGTITESLEVRHRGKARRVMIVDLRSRELSELKNGREQVASTNA